MMKPLDVAAAIIRDPSGAVLLARRPAHKHQGGLWEFPGGKLEPGESAHQALCREIAEELGLQVTQSRPFMTICHDYPEFRVRLMFREVTRWSGDAVGREGQPLRWQPQAQLAELDFPRANQPLVHALQMPDQLLVLPEALPGDWRQRLEHAVSGGVGLVYARGRSAGKEMDTIAGACDTLGAGLMVADDASLARSLGARVLHLREARAASCTADAVAGPWWLSVACHDYSGLQRARELGAHMALLSPVAATPTHPDAQPLGWRRFGELAIGQPFAVYALGGMSPASLGQARDAGARGVAGIRSFW